MKKAYLWNLEYQKGLCENEPYRMADNIYRHIGRRVREERVQRGWTQEQLAERADSTLSFVGQLERGIKKPSLLTLKKIADACGIKAGSLLDEGEPSSRKASAAQRFSDILGGYSPREQESLLKIFRLLARQIKKFPRS